MRIDPKHPLARTVWWAFIIVDACLVLMLVVLAVAKPFFIADPERAFRVDPTYNEQASDLVGESPLLALIHQFDLDKEKNIAVWVSSQQFAIGGLLALLVFFTLPRKRSSISAGWLLIGLALLFLSLEETATLHETIDNYIRVPLPEGIVTYGWVPIYAIPLAIATVLVILWLRKAFADNRRLRRLAFGGITCWVGTFVLEATARYLPHAFIRVEVLFEESLELTGALLFIYVFAHYQASLAAEPSAEEPSA